MNANQTPSDEWGITETLWANHPNDPKDKPRSRYCWNVKGGGEYLSPIHRESIALLVSASPKLLKLATRIANLNPDAGEIGAGMLNQLVTDARAIVAKATICNTTNQDTK